VLEQRRGRPDSRGKTSGVPVAMVYRMGSGGGDPPASMLEYTLVIVAVALGGGLLPLFVGRSDRLLHLFISLATGLFLGVVFLHMLPEVAELATHEGGAITVRAAAGESGPELVVADNGPGIAEQERERISERFYRGAAAEQASGSGLGLALVAAIADLHGARLAFEDNAPGLRARLQFRG